MPVHNRARALVATAVLSLGSLAAGPAAWGQGAVPSRQVPPSVLAEVQMLGNRFELALAADCDAGRCFSKGCTYVDHAVADQPRSTSLPGLGDDAGGPGSVAPQEYLTRARCSFAHEESVSAADVSALVRRLQSKLSTGWTVVTVDHQTLQPIAAELQKPVEATPPEPVEPVEPPVVQWSASVAARELWTSLLPHFAWMIAVVMLTVAGLTLVWAWRRVGRESFEEKALLAQLARGGADADADDKDKDKKPEEMSEDDRAFVARQSALWSHRLESARDGTPDPELQALIRELLRTRDLPLLAKAVLQFPDSFVAAFPTGGDVATAKLELADYLVAVDTASLPTDVAFFRVLERHARSAALVSQSDALMVRSLREDFGASGLVALIGSVPPRTGALLFALAPAEEQQEMVRLLSTQQMVSLCEQLLRSNRMPRPETAYLFRVLEAARADEPLPPAPPLGEAADRGAEFDAAAALSVLLPNLSSTRRNALFASALTRFNGSLPAWYRGIFLADMLFAISDEARNDLLLELDVETLAAWLALADPDTRDRVVEDLPDSLRASVGAAVFPSRARLLALAWRGRQDLARGFQQQLARANLPFEQVVQGQAEPPLRMGGQGGGGGA